MKTSTIPTLLGPDGMTSLREYAGYHGRWQRIWWAVAGVEPTG